MINTHDLEQLKQKGISESTITEQLGRFIKDFPFLNILRHASLEDGIKSLSEDESTLYHKEFEEAISKGLSTGKFVPASGAATRMFKDLYQYLENPQPIDALESDSSIVQFIERLPDFSFFPLLEELMPNYDLSNDKLRKTRAEEIVKKTLSSEGLNYGNLPKGLIHFHTKSGEEKTAMEDQILEGVSYVKNADKSVKIHFTVSSGHHTLFLNKLDKIRKSVETENDVKLDITFSFQKPHTDTLAVTPDNEPFRDKEGELIFRPGGHGALLENLNDQEYDIIFIKNIDNIASAHLWEDTIKYKKALGGLLISIKDRSFDFLNKLDKNADNNLIKEIISFIKSELHLDLSPIIEGKGLAEQVAFLHKYLNRPIRLCGMVKNEGEPGGGPFWIKESSGIESLQILESSQFDAVNPKHQEIIKKSTHFNPVDLVCYTKNYKGEKFNLLEYKDPDTGFISDKTFNGKPLKALELPGLWNGAMANWLTLFVEVPITTFDPVKTVNDLLKERHLSE